MLVGMFAAAMPSAADEEAVFGFLTKHCARCHNNTEASGDLNLVNLQLQDRQSFDQHREA